MFSGKRLACGAGAEGKVEQPFFYEVDGGKPFALAELWE
jgi:hypothetical protein